MATTEVPGSSASMRSLTSLAFDRLRTGILSGELRPAERLKILQLSERYEIGATAIREALSRLVTDGLVESEDQRGFCVACVSPEDLQDLTRTRIWVEQAALRMAIEKGDLEWETAVLGSFHRLSKMLTTAASPESAAAWRSAHRQFHFALVEGSGSPWTVKLCSTLYDQTERYRNLSERVPANRGRDVLKEHRQLMDAALARNADRACELIARHFQSTTNIILASGVVGEQGQKAQPVRRKAA